MGLMSRDASARAIALPHLFLPESKYVLAPQLVASMLEECRVVFMFAKQAVAIMAAGL
jgi:hypothetical protein